MMSVDETALDPGKRLPLDTANYIAELTAELSSLAQGANLEQVAYLLDLARLEAERVAALSDDFRSD